VEPLPPPSQPGARVGTLSFVATVAVAVAAAFAPGGGDAAAGPADRLTDAQLVGQRIVVGFGGRRPSGDLERRIRRGRVGGVILFDHNVRSRAGVRRTVRRLQAIPRPRPLSEPLLVMVDQEGGLVKRLPGPPSMSAERMARSGTGTCRRQGVATGRSLDGVGVNVDLAPVLDVALPGSAMDREGRAFGSSPGSVWRCGGTFARALERPRVAVTAKHFPGIGSARVNTDFRVQRIGLSKRSLRRSDERPFGRFARGRAGRRLVMISSAIYTSFSPRPASFTRAIATGELRGRLGFEGVSISDALDTASARHFGGTAKVARSVAAAGTDLLLYTNPRDGARAARALTAALRRGHIGRPNFVDSATRVLELRNKLGK
jgi:beta-N-acetylhexosaminidase